MKLISAISIGLLMAAAFVVEVSATPQAHPAYLHALSDLRDARAHLQRPNSGVLEHQERDAVAEIDKAIGEIKAASINDGKNIDDHARVDMHMPWAGRLHTAFDLLKKAHNDIAQEEDRSSSQSYMPGPEPLYASTIVPPSLFWTHASHWSI